MLLAVPAGSIAAQESDALINALIRKGILSQQEAEDIRAELVEESTVPPADVEAGGKATERLSVGMRMQMQYANLDTDVRGSAFGPAATQHAFLRRMYLSLKAGIGGNWGAAFTYDFASGGYDDAILQWKPGNDLTFDFGLRKVNVAYEERASSGNIRAIERSSVTRYFVEENNGRRLGAASYRIGVFLDGKKAVNSTHGLVYSAAVTNPERSDDFSIASSAGDRTINDVALWANVGLTGKLAEGSWIAGVGAGFLPDQGGADVADLGLGSDLTLYSLYTEVTAGRFSFMGEYLSADVERGASATTDAQPSGFYLQPALLLTSTIEAVVRYASLDSDGRGVTLSDVVRSAPSGGTMDKAMEWYAGANWYLRGNELKYQLGFVYGKSKDALDGESAEAEAVGVRSQLQMQF